MRSHDPSMRFEYISAVKFLRKRIGTAFSMKHSIAETISKRNRNLPMFAERTMCFRNDFEMFKSLNSQLAKREI
jgi:hypothetical protein